MCTVNTIQVLILAALGVSLVATFVMRMPSANRSRARKLLAQAEWLDDDTADGTYVKVRGVVAMRAHGERFLSPLTKNRCVVMRLRAAVRHGRDPRSKLVENLKIMPFVIEDENGTMPIEATAAELDVATFKSSKWTPADKRQVLMDLGHDRANPEASQVDETLVEIGQTVTVAGKLQKSEREPKKRLVGDAEQPIAIAIERVRDRDLSADP
jgi:E3 Ubiquitin ligase